MGRRGKKQRKRKHKDESRRVGETRASQALRRKLAAAGVVNLLGPDSGAPKASDALVKVVEPLLDRVAAESGMNQERMESILRLGVLAWNAHSLGYTSIHPFLQRYGADKLALDDEDEFMVSALLEPLLHRRRKLFGDDPRMLADFVVLDSPSGEFRISVAWAKPNSAPALT